MVITREQIIKKLSDKSGYWQKDIRFLLKCLDEVVTESFSEITDDEELMIQIVEGCKLKAYVNQERQRVDPRDGQSITCPPTVKLGVKYSDVFKNKIQTQYETKKDG